MIIIEGPDNSGKSTLAAKLKRDTDLKVIHSVAPQKDWSSRMTYEHCLKQVAPQSRMAILDRVTAISESIYGPICRGESRLGEYQADALLDVWRRPYTIIYCRPSDETILDNKGRPQMSGVLENHQKIIDAYDALMEDLMQFGTPMVIRHDWQDRNHYRAILSLVQSEKKHYISTVQSATFMSMLR